MAFGDADLFVFAEDHGIEINAMPLMPWRSCWQVPCFAFCFLVFASLAAGLSVKTSVAAKERFGRFYRGDISAFFAESWKVSVPLVLASALSLFLCCWHRHPLEPLGNQLQHWNLVATIASAFSSVGLAGVGIFTQNDNTNTSAYPLQNDIAHGICMFCAAGSVLLYMCLHTGTLLHDTVEGVLAGDLIVALVVVQFALIVSAGMHFALWLVESSRERYPDDPQCNKRSEWLCALTVGCYFATLPIMTQCIAHQSVIMRVLARLALGMIGLVSCWILLCFRMLNAPSPRGSGGPHSKQSRAEKLDVLLEPLPNLLVRPVYATIETDWKV